MLPNGTNFEWSSIPASAIPYPTLELNPITWEPPFEDTDYYLKRGFRVVSIEADIDLVKLNQARFSEYLTNGKLNIIYGAISDTEESQITFYKNTKVSVWGTTVKSWAQRNSSLGADSIEVTVPVVRLSDLFKEYGIPYYLKIDIEGMDLVALKTLLNFETRPKYISIESEKVEFSKLVEEFDVFEALGYNEFSLVEQSGLHKLKVPIGSTEGELIDYSFDKGSSGLFGTDLQTEWVDREQAIRRYKAIFREYKLFGDNSIFKLRFLRVLRRIIQRVIRRPLPGWYDTHARLK